MGKGLADVNKGNNAADADLRMLVKARTCRDEYRRGFIIDGLPRRFWQIGLLDDVMESLGICKLVVLCLDLPREKAEQRLKGRWTHTLSGRVYHETLDPPKSMRYVGSQVATESMKDDATGQPLVVRKDDTEEGVRKRLDDFQTNASPILKEYSERGGAKDDRCGCGQGDGF